MWGRVGDNLIAFNDNLLLGRADRDVVGLQERLPRDDVADVLAGHEGIQVEEVRTAPELRLLHLTDDGGVGFRRAALRQEKDGHAGLPGEALADQAGLRASVEADGRGEVVEHAAEVGRCERPLPRRTGGEVDE